MPAASPAPPSGAAIIPPVLYQPPPSLTPTDIAEHLQALAGTGNEDGDGPIAPFQHQAPFVHPDPSIIGGTNQNLPDFLYTWYRQRRPPGARLAYRVPWPSKANEQMSSHISHVQYADLEGDCCDFQGLNWEHMGVSRRDARERRFVTYHNYTSLENADLFRRSDASLPNTDAFFRFRRMDIKRNVLIMHFQLRNIIASTSRAETFYTADHAVLRFDPISGIAKTIMKVPYTQVSTLAAKHGVLMAGCFNGQYILRNIDSRSDASGCEVGTITKDTSGITNHIQIYESRTGSSPVAAIASNDMGVRTLDLNTRTWLSTVKFSSPVNCTAVSPDRRLRVVVGDDTSVYVIPTESTLAGGKPEILYKLNAHRDCAFACDWADDGWTVATGCQDRTVKIWDARKWTDTSGAANPVTSIRSEMACVRSLHFSPVGSGKRVLVAVEEADFVNIIDAHTFTSKQRFDVFGEIGGAAFTGDGQDLHVLCADFARGGIMQLERCALGSEASWGVNLREDRTSFDWPPSVFTQKNRIQQSATRRRRRAAALDALEPF
ncbi:WD40 repeat-like protein [Thozetella sp. PMI_491]|nr:WD40 repeat-like protein [Thozetella sp. PMI_491]